MKAFLRVRTFLRQFLLCVFVLVPLLSVSRSSLASQEISAEISASFAVPGSSPTALAWDGASLWMVDNLKNL